jgi:hypothetical protein
MEIIQQVWVNKFTGQKCVTIPKSVNIKKGDYVRIKKVRVDETD